MTLDPARLLEVVFDAIFVFDWGTGKITSWNAGAEALYGWSREEAIGRRPDELLKTELPAERAEIRRSLEKTGRWEGSLIQRTRDGVALVVDARWVLDAQTNAVVEINRDATLAWQSADTLRELERARSEFIEQVAHHLRSPVTVLRGYVQLLEERRIPSPDGSDPQFVDALARLRASTDEMHRVTERLVSAARVDVGRAEVHLTRCNLSAIARRVVHEVSWSAASDGRIRFDCPDSDVVVAGDPNHLDMVIRELVGAALDSTPVAVHLHSEGQRALVEVTGSAVRGLPEPRRGTGWELSRRIARLHGGELEAAIEADRLKLRLRLPLAG